MATADELIAEADRLDAQHEYRQAAELRMQALGPKPYPVVICGSCFAITGWVGSDGACAACWTRKREETSNTFLPAGAPAIEQSTRGTRRLKRLLGVGTPRDRAREWLAVVDPGTTGPIDPEEGWDLEVAVKQDVPPPEGPHRLVRFDVQSMRFQDVAWRPCPTSRGGTPRILVPRELPANLPIEQLAEAWNDFEEEVAAHNRAFWQAESARRCTLVGPDEEERGTAALLG
jgi:hypothetical protein